jgi:hypothetical protein
LKEKNRHLLSLPRKNIGKKGLLCGEQTTFLGKVTYIYFFQTLKICNEPVIPNNSGMLRKYLNFIKIQI